MSVRTPRYFVLLCSLSDNKGPMSCVDCGTRGKVCPVNGIRIQGARPPTHRLLPTIRLSDGSHQLTGQGLGIGVAPYGLPALPQNLGPTIPGDHFQAGIPVSMDPASVPSVLPNCQHLAGQCFAEGGCSCQLPSQPHGN